MFIERLHLKGFKSFGSASELLFSPGLTAIVGPNGSGKSNLLDALRWVLGDGSALRLRIARQGDLLFSGSPSLPPASRAEVTLSLRKDDREGSPGCLLKRIYSEDSGTVLTVDGLRMRLSDLDGVKRLWHLEGDQFAFIGQGEIADTIHHRPAQRRAHLEVLFGIDQYRKKRNESLVRLSAAGEENRRLDALLAELTLRRDFLAPAAEIARRARSLTDELEEKRRTAYFHRRFLLEEEQKTLGEEISLLEERAGQKSRWKELWEKMGARSLARRGALEEKIEALRGEREELLTRRAALQRNCFAAASSVREIRDRLEALEREGEDLSEKIRLREAEASVLLGEEEELAREHSALREECGVLRKSWEEHFARLEEERIRRKKRLDALSALLAEKEILASKLQSKEAVEKNCAADLSSAEEAAESLGKTGDSLREKLRIAGEGEERARERHGTSLAQCRTTASLLQQGKKERTALERTLEDLKNAQTALSPEPVRVLISASRLGKLPFPVRAAAEAFTCPPEFTLALESWLGGRQYWILVHTVEEAGRCIELLKERRAGRATFLPLERSRPRSPSRGFSLPQEGIAGWAADLITPGEEWRAAVDHLLGDLLLVNTYSVGSEILRRGASFPVATLEGDVFAPSGTVSGGKGRSAGGAIERRQQIAAAEEKIAAGGESLRLLSLRLEEEEREERRLSTEKEESTLLVREIRDSLERNGRELSLALNRKSRLEKEMLSARQDIGALRGRIASIESETKGLQEEERPGDDQFSEKMAGDLTERENRLALAGERLAGRRTLRKRAEDELEAERQRMALLSREREQILRRQKEEKERLSLWGREQGAIFSSLKEREGALNLLLDRERGFLSRAGRIASRTKKAAEEGGALRESLAALIFRRSSLAGEISRMADQWDETCPYRREDVPPAREGAAAEAAVRRLERELKALGPVEWGALSEGEALSERIDYLTGQLDDVKAAVGELQAIVDETDRQVAELFNAALENINSRFNALFRRLFGGGEARLQLEERGGPGSDPAGPEEGDIRETPSPWDRGVEIVARPPGKHLQNLAQLSGGEQSLTAIAHLFASMEVAKVPLAVLDEVDAALDESNLLRFGELAKEYAVGGETGEGRGIQLLVMTHRRATMERADILYGVTLAEPGLSKVIGMRMSDWVEPELEPEGKKR